MEHVLVTGAAGFIGYHISDRLLREGFLVTGLDNLNPYYDVTLKKARLGRLERKKGFSFVRCDLENREEMEKLFQQVLFDRVIHLAAQAGVRYSVEHPEVYISSNLVGFFHILEGCRKARVKHLVFASTSSVYGANKAIPFSTHHHTDHPLSLYAATKKSNELLAHVYSALYQIPSTGLRFFTVYGPWGRPDMALFKFTKSILEGKPIDVYNYGNMKRDFTYIDDVVEGVFRVMQKAPVINIGWDANHPDPSSSFAPYRLYNLGSSNPVGLMEFITVLEEELGKKAQKNFLPLQPGDVPETFADVSELEEDFGYKPGTDLRHGIKQFVKWYREYFEL
ncbi:MAG: NAD-dependent epimerase [Deltaproteobacteria bacterium]|nr:NAD-dependent epimerase [Deltaproteobacteria bacterium]